MTAPTATVIDLPTRHFDVQMRAADLHIDTALVTMQLAARYPEWNTKWLQHLGLWPVEPGMEGQLDTLVECLPPPQ